MPHDIKKSKFQMEYMKATMFWGKLGQRHAISIFQM